MLQLQRVPTTSILKFYTPVSFPVVEKVSRVEEVGEEESGLTLKAGGEEIGMTFISIQYIIVIICVHINLHQVARDYYYLIGITPASYLGVLLQSPGRV